MALAIESGDASRIGAELAGPGQKNRDEIVAWLLNNVATLPHATKIDSKPWNEQFSSLLSLVSFQM
jgi:hypothetical protein